MKKGRLRAMYWLICIYNLHHREHDISTFIFRIYFDILGQSSLFICELHCQNVFVHLIFFLVSSKVLHRLVHSCESH
jgi:hypothetical protein